MRVVAELVAEDAQGVWGSNRSGGPLPGQAIPRRRRRGGPRIGDEGAIGAEKEPGLLGIS